MALMVGGSSSPLRMTEYPILLNPECRKHVKDWLEIYNESDNPVIIQKNLEEMVRKIEAYLNDFLLRLFHGNKEAKVDMVPGATKRVWYGSHGDNPPGKLIRSLFNALDLTPVIVETFESDAGLRKFPANSVRSDTFYFPRGEQAPWIMCVKCEAFPRKISSFFKYQNLRLLRFPPYAPVPAQSVNSVMDTLYKESLTSAGATDLCFIGPKGERVYAHSSILMISQSKEYFVALLKGGMKETVQADAGKKKEITIPENISAEHFKAIIKFLYLEKFDISNESPVQELLALRKYAYQIRAEKAEKALETPCNEAVKTVSNFASLLEILNDIHPYPFETFKQCARVRILNIIEEDLPEEDLPHHPPKKVMLEELMIAGTNLNDEALLHIACTLFMYDPEGLEPTFLNGINVGTLPILEKICRENFYAPLEGPLKNVKKYANKLRETYEAIEVPLSEDTIKAYAENFLIQRAQAVIREQGAEGVKRYVIQILSQDKKIVDAAKTQANQDNRENWRSQAMDNLMGDPRFRREAETRYVNKESEVWKEFAINSLMTNDQIRKQAVARAANAISTEQAAEAAKQAKQIKDALGEIIEDYAPKPPAAADSTVMPFIGSGL